MTNKNEGTQVSTFTILKSALSAMLGVQSNSNRERDFKSGKFWHFFIAGIFVTAAFMLCVWLAVQFLLATN